MKLTKTICLIALGIAAATVPCATQATELRLFRTFDNTDYASSGVGGTRETGYGEIDLTNIPPGAVIKQAYLYWEALGHASEFSGSSNAIAYINGEMVNANAVGVAGSDGWSPSPFNLTFGRAYRADVTAFITGNGAYVVSDIDPMGLTVEGASLIVLFDDGDTANDKSISIYDGCDQNSPNTFDSSGWNINIPGVSYSSGDAVSVEFHVGDGQSQYNENPLLLNNTKTITPFGNYFSGSAPYDPVSGFRFSFFTGSLWDINEYHLESLLSPGVNNLNMTSDYYDDDLSVIVVVLKSKSGSITGGGTTNRPPSITCPSTVTYDCVSLLGANNTTQVTVSDPDANALTVTWRINNIVVRQDQVAASVNQTTLSLTAIYPLGTSTIEATVSDSQGGIQKCQSLVLVTSVDTTAPVVDCGPNVQTQAGTNKLATVPSVVGQVSATDGCTPVLLLLTTQSPAAGSTVGVGTNIITVSVRDLSGNVGTCTVPFIVTPAPVSTNRPPVANNDSASTSCGNPVTINVLYNDADPDGKSTLSILSFTQPTMGVVTQVNGNLVLAPAAGFTGTIKFNYTITDGKYTATACVTVTVSGCCGQQNYCTYTQGGWGNNSGCGNNPGTLLKNNFCRVYSRGVCVGGSYTATLSSCTAVANCLPQGSTPIGLKKSCTNPTSNLTCLLGQTVALKLNCDFSNSGVTAYGLGGLHVARGKCAGYTVSQVLSCANKVLGGQTSALPSGCSVSELNDICSAINQNFDGGNSNCGYLIK